MGGGNTLRAAIVPNVTLCNGISSVVLGEHSYLRGFDRSEIYDADNVAHHEARDFPRLPPPLTLSRAHMPVTRAFSKQRGGFPTAGRRSLITAKAFMNCRVINDVCVCVGTVRVSGRR